VAGDLSELRREGVAATTPWVPLPGDAYWETRSVIRRWADGSWTSYEIRDAETHEFFAAESYPTEGVPTVEDLRRRFGAIMGDEAAKQLLTFHGLLTEKDELPQTERPAEGVTPIPVGPIDAFGRALWKCDDCGESFSPELLRQGSEALAKAAVAHAESCPAKGNGGTTFF